MTAPRAREHAEPPAPPDLPPPRRGGRPSTETPSAAGRPAGPARLAGARRGLVRSARALAAAALLALSGAVAVPAQAQTVVLVSNTGQADDGSRAPDSIFQFAQAFDTGSNTTGYNLASVVLDFTDAPTGTGTLTVTVRENNSGDPSDTALYTMTGSASIVAGENEFTAPSGASLDGSTLYYVVSEYDTDGGPTWTGTLLSNGVDSGNADGWDIDDGQMVGADLGFGVSWDVSSTTRAFQIQVKGSAKSGSDTPTLSIADASGAEDAGVEFTATLSATTTAAVTATWTASIETGDTAVAADLGTTKTGTVTVMAGQPSGTFDVPTAADTVNEPDETFTVTLSSVSTNATLGTATATGTITNDDVPAAPTGLAAGVGNAQVGLTWDAPATGANITHHEYRFKTGGGSYPTTWTQIATSAPGGTNEASYTVTGLTNEIAHTFELRAWNDSGGGAADEDGPVTPTAQAQTNSAPEFPSPGVAFGWAENWPPGTVIGNSATRLTATDADTGDTLTYSLEGTDADSFDFDPSTRELKAKFGVTYDFEATKNDYRMTVRVVDGNGGTDTIGVRVQLLNVRGEQSATPDKPTLAAVPGSSTSLTASWTKPGRNGGPHITGYDVQYREGTTDTWMDFTHSDTAITTTITGLTVDTSYQVQVRALNGDTPSDWSDPSDLVRTNLLEVTLHLSDDAVLEDATPITVTATVSPASSVAFTVEISASPVAPATDDEFELSSGRELLFTANATESTGLVTIRPVDDDEPEPPDVVTISGVVSNPAIPNPDDVTLTIHNDDKESFEVAVDAPAAVDEGAGTATVTYRLTKRDGAPVAHTDVIFYHGDAQTATRGVDYTPPVGNLSGGGLVVLETGLPPSAFSNTAGTVWVAEDSFTIGIVDDQKGEQDETIVFRVEAGGGESPEQTIVIRDNDAVVPGRPTDLSASAKGQTRIQLAWTAPADEGSFPITHYRIEASENAGSSWNVVARTRDARTDFRHGGLSAGDTRHYRVSAVSDEGVSAPSNVASATTVSGGPPATNPNLPPPDDVTAAPKLPGQIRLGWWTPNLGGSIDSYRYRMRVAGAGDWSDWTRVNRMAAAFHSVFVDDLDAGTTYEFQVRSVDKDDDYSAVATALGTATGTQTIWIEAPSGTVTEGEPLRFTLSRGQPHGRMYVILRISETGDMLPQEGRRPNGLWTKGVYFGDGNETIPVVLETVDDGDADEPDSRVKVEVMPYNEKLYKVHGSRGSATKRVTARSAGSPSRSVAPLTAEFADLPSSHEGTAFTFRLEFSEDVATSAADMRDHALTVTGGTVTDAARVDGRADRWSITVTPSGTGEVLISLPPGRDCSETGAVCTSDGRQLPTGLAQIVASPVNTAGTVPRITAVQVTSVPELERDTYGRGETIRFTVSFSEAVEVTGSPHFTFSLGNRGVARKVDAAYESGSGTAALVFGYEVQEGDEDDNGIFLVESAAFESTGRPPGPVGLDAGEAITALGGGVAADLTSSVRGNQSAHKVDGSRAPEGSTPPVDGPVNRAATGAPAISGTAQVGEELTASTSGITDADGLDNATFAYQWLRDGAAISGATGRTYTAVAADEGERLKVRVDFTDDAGHAESLTSAATDAVAAAAAATNSPATGRPEIGGTAQVGEELTASTSGISDADGLEDAVFRYQWLRDGAAISGATGRTYTAVDADEGERLKVRVDFTDDAGNAESVTSGSTARVAARPNTPAEGRPEIRGTAQVGEELRVSTSGISDADGLEDVRFRYQWRRGGGDIPGATGRMYTAVAADEGERLQVRVDFSDDAGNAESVTSAATDAVAARPNTPAEGRPAIAGKAQVGEELTASTSGISDADGLDDVRFRYQWLRGGAAISGATGSDYTAVDADEGERLQVRVDFSDDAGNAERLTSRSTEAVAAANTPAEGRPEIGGTARVGETLTASTAGISDADGLEDVRYRYRWLRDGAAIPGATGSRYTAVDADEGERLKVRVDFSDDVGNAERLTSGSTKRVAARPLPKVSIADARVREAEGATLDFAVTLSAPAPGPVTVDYRTLDASATAGEDYVARAGTLRIAAGGTGTTLRVTVLDDAVDEGEEKMVVVLQRASGAERDDYLASGTIENRDPLPRALLARFGRTAAVHVVEQVEERLEARRAPGFEGRFAGRALRPGMEREVAESFLRRLGGLAGAGSSRVGDPLADIHDPLERRTAVAGGGGLGAAAGLGGALGGEGGLEDAFSGEGLLRLGLGGGDVLTGSGFALNRATRHGGMLSLWSRGAQSRFSGREGALSLGGAVRSTMFGADYVRGALTAGLSLSHSGGVGEYAGAHRGEVVSSVTGLYPWLGYQATERVSVWGVAGRGAGRLALTPEGGTALASGLSLSLAAAGARGELLGGGGAAGAGFGLAFKADALWVGTSTEGVDGPGGRMAATSAAVSRVRTALEASRGFRFGSGLSVKPSVEVGVRRDGGDAERGAGLDMGGGVVVTAPSVGLSADLKVRMLLAHAAEEFRERGVSVSLSYDPTPATPFGLRARLSPSWGGQATSGAAALWGRETLAGLASGGRSAPGGRLDAELGYGLPLGRRLVGTPRLAVRSSGMGRDYRLGYGLGVLDGGPLRFELGIDAQRRESPLAGRTNHGVAARATLSW